MVAGIEYGHGVAAEVGNVGTRLWGRDRHPHRAIADADRGNHRAVGRAK